MAVIRGEPAGSRGEFIRKVILGFVSACIALNAVVALRLGDRSDFAALLAFGLITLFAYGVLNGLATAAFYLLSRTAALIQRVMSWLEDRTARLLTAVIEWAAHGVMWLISLPFRLIRLGWQYAYDLVVALIQRKRRLDELKKLYEYVKSDYTSFEEFVSKTKADEAKKKADEEKRRKQNSPPPAPRSDPFSQACAVLGLPCDGAFTEAEFKQRYGAIIRAVHPDIVGQNSLASQVNQARDMIRKRKGW